MDRPAYLPAGLGHDKTDTTPPLHLSILPETQSVRANPTDIVAASVLLTINILMILMINKKVLYSYC